MQILLAWVKAHGILRTLRCTVTSMHQCAGRIVASSEPADLLQDTAAVDCAFDLPTKEVNPAKRLRRPQVCAVPPTHRATPHQTGSARRPHQCPASQTCPRICTGTRGNTTAQAAGSTNKQPRNSQIGERKRSPKPDQCLRGVPLREQIYWLGIRVPLKLHYHGLQPLRNTTRIREFLREIARQCHRTARNEPLLGGEPPEFRAHCAARSRATPSFPA